MQDNGRFLENRGGARIDDRTGVEYSAQLWFHVLEH